MPIAVVLSALLISLSSIAWGSDQPLGPLPKPVTVYYNPEGSPEHFHPDRVSLIIMRSIGIWQAACGYSVVSYGGQTTEAPDEGKGGRSVIGWGNHQGKYAGLTWRGKGNQVDILLIPEGIPSMEELGTVIIHEFGHLYGLGHREGVMAASPDYATLPRVSQEDAQECRRIYTEGRHQVGITFRSN